MTHSEEQIRNGLKDLLDSVPEDLRGDVARSFLVPQRGDHHNEGGFMKSHLLLVLTTLEDMGRESGPRIDERVPAAFHLPLHVAAGLNMDVARKYVALHDLKKADCMTFVLEGGQKVAMSWADWQAVLDGHSRGGEVREGSEEALKAVLDDLKVESISYYQERSAEGGGKPTKVMHGPEAADFLRARGDISELVVDAIDTHEVAFNFVPGRVNIDLVERKFGEWDDLKVNFMVVVNLADQLGSHGLDGQPDIRPVLALIDSIDAFRAFRELQLSLQLAREGAPGHRKIRFDEQKLAGALARIRKSDTAFPEIREFGGFVNAAGVAFDALVKECELPTYDETILRIALDELVEEKKLDASLVDEIIANLLTDGQISKTVGGKLKATNQLVRKAIERAIVKTA